MLLLSGTWLCGVGASGLMSSMLFRQLLSTKSINSMSLHVKDNLFWKISFVLALAFFKYCPNIKVNTSPLNSIRRIKIQTCWPEKSSISTVAMLETVNVETDVKMRSRLLRVDLCCGLRFLRARKPAKDIDMK
ncbi:hypothetical protein U9M48_033737 [Paspalum notatum var. saurae]|uniref:Uncharacterized protein n=1 Tax=Paspalum notatum var. saurae TaxID=547442 RepID=A0AAQ3X6H9_PASNO